MMRLHQQLMRWLLACTVLLAALPAFAKSPGEPFHIYMIVWRGCEDACQGFQDYFVERNIPATFTIRDAGRDKKRLPRFAGEAKAMDVDLVVTWGTSVTLGIVGHMDKVDPDIHITNIPVVFMIVADPVGAKIVASYDSSGRPNITGTLNRVPEEVQMNAIRAYRDFDKLGLIYNTNEVNSVLKSKEILLIAEKVGFDVVELVLDLNEEGKPIVESIQKKVAEAKEQGVDFLYVASSSFLMANRDVFTNAAIEYGVPLAVPYDAMVVKSNGLLAIASRYYNVGKLAGYQAEQVLVEHIPPIEIPIRGLNRFSYIINMETARQLRFYPPLSVLRYAEIINARPVPPDQPSAESPAKSSVQ